MTRERVFQRDGFRCLRCGTTSPGVGGWSIHHRQGRGGANPDRASNLVLLCGSGTTGCHGEVHAHPAESYDTGWMVRRLGDDDTTEVPLQTLTGRLICLSDDYDVFNALTGSDWRNA